MKKILMSILVIGVTFAMLGAGTFSYFSDEETSAGNTFSAGTIDIEIDTENPWTSYEILAEAKPCETRYIDFTIKNVGLNPCVIWKHIEITAEEGGEYPEPESVVDPGDTITDISNWILYDLVVDEDVIFYDEDGYTLNDIACMWMPLGQILQPGETMDVIQSYHLKPETGNAYQGDYVEFTITLYAEQKLGNGPVQQSNKLFLDNKDGEPNWYFIADHIWGVLDWTDGPDLADLFATGLQASTQYSLITYVDPWPGTVTELTFGNTNSAGELTINDFSMGSTYYGKVLLVLKADHNGAQMTGWNPTAYLYEANKVNIL